jgi:hypothetical protein
MSGYDPVGIRVQPMLARLHRESVRGTPSPVPFSTVCIGLGIPSDPHTRLLRKRISEGYVTEVSIGRVQLTEAGIAQIAAPHRR